MGSVADYNTLNPKMIRKPYGYIDYRATISVYKYGHCSSPQNFIGMVSAITISLGFTAQSKARTLTPMPATLASVSPKALWVL